MKAFLLVLSLGWCLNGFAQQEYFVFIQHEKREPFYVRIGEKNHSSSSNGHVILSRLKDSSYTITVGFPQNLSPEQEFIVRINRKDRGFELKNLSDKGWALFDLQTLELINSTKSVRTQSGGSAYNLIKKDDNFARLMAGVVNDTAVMYTVVIEEKKPVMVSVPTDTTSTVAKIETPQKAESSKTEQPIAEVKKDSPQVVKNTVPAVNDTFSVVKDVVTKPAVNDTSSVAKDIVTKPGEQIEQKKTGQKPVDSVRTEQVVNIPKKPEQDVTISKKTEPDVIKDSVLNPPALPVIHVVRRQVTDTGYLMVIVDDVKDSIDIFIPQDVTQQVIDKKETSKPSSDSVKKITQPEAGVKKVDSLINKPVTNEVKADTMPPVLNTADVPAKADTAKTKKLVMINSDCKAFAISNDVDKLRVSMLKAKDSDDRINAAKKIFRTKCFSALQIKALSEMFPYDEQKYKFLETAYPFVSDTYSFKGLVSLLSDPVYVARFRKLVRLD